MQNKEFKRHIAYEVLTILGTLALLLFVCRLWPILLLVILGIFIAAMRLLFLSARKAENIPPLLPAARPEPTDQDIRDMAFGSMQRRITELVTADFPNARWVWKTPNAMRNIATGNEVRILLNHAGGYREAIVVIRGLQVCSLTYPHAEEVKMPETENDETGREETGDDTPQKVEPPENYLVLYQGEKRPSGYKSYCANCGQKNYQLAADGNCTCGVCGRPTRVNFSQTHIQVVTYPGRGTDDGEDFEDWSMHALRERVKLVQELDQLADRMVELALRLTREAQVIEEEYFIPQTRKVLVTTP